MGIHYWFKSSDEFNKVHLGPQQTRYIWGSYLKKIDIKKWKFVCNKIFKYFVSLNASVIIYHCLIGLHAC